MVADDGALGEAIVRVRGWGRISYLENPKALQDEVGAIIVEALNDFWEGHTPQNPHRQNQQKPQKTEPI